MPTPTQTYSFNSLVPGIGFTGGRVDHAKAIIFGVSVITSDCEAEGHDLHVDATTVSQLKAKAGHKVPVNLDHGSGIKDTCGFLTNFHVVGNKLRADWHLLKSHDETPKMMERAEVMPECFGLSVKFKGKGETKGLKKFARCEKLLSVDCVTQPAANADGLFSAKVDSGAVTEMATRKQIKTEEPGAEPTLQDIANLLTQQTESLADLGNRMEAIEQGGNPGEDEIPADGQLTDEQIDELVASGQLLDNGDGTLSWADQAGEGEDEGDLAGAGAGADAANAANATAMSAVREINQFRAQLRTRELQAAQSEEDHAFAVLDQHIEALTGSNEELVTALAARDEQIVALQRTLRLTGKGPAPSRGTEILFRKGEEGEFETLLSAKVEELKAETPALTKLQARARAIDFCVRNHRDAYSEYRHRGGKIQFEK